MTRASGHGRLSSALRERSEEKPASPAVWPRWNLPSAIQIAEASSFALGVQWHAEYDPQRNPINRKLFEAFGEAMVAKQRAAA